MSDKGKYQPMILDELLTAEDEIQSLQQQLDEAKDELGSLKLEAGQAKELRIKKFARFNNEECWIYDEDGDNNLESLVCPVVIRPEKLIEIAASQKCDCCLGEPISGKPCICDGTGTSAGEKVGLRQEVFKLQKQVEEADKKMKRFEKYAEGIAKTVEENEKKLEQQIVSEFDLTDIPSFKQGIPAHENESIVTAERCTWLVNEIASLHQQVDGLRELFDIQSGDNQPVKLFVTARFDNLHAHEPPYHEVSVDVTEALSQLKE